MCCRFITTQRKVVKMFRCLSLDLLFPPSESCSSFADYFISNNKNNNSKTDENIWSLDKSRMSSIIFGVTSSSWIQTQIQILTHQQQIHSSPTHSPHPRATFSQHCPTYTGEDIHILKKQPFSNSSPCLFLPFFLVKKQLTKG